MKTQMLVVSFFGLVIHVGCSSVPAAAPRVPAAVGDKASLVQLAKGLIEKQTANVDRVYQTTGFRDTAELAAASAKVGGDYERAFQILDKGDVQVTVMAPEKLRDVLLRGGIANTHETQTSGGVNDGDLRNGVEGAYMEMPFSEFKNLPNAVKPKYGYLAPKANSLSAGLNPPRGVWNYGEDRWVLKLDKISDRLTLTAGDSLNNLMAYMDPGEYTIYADRTEETKHWAFRYIPWARRQLMAPMLALGIGKPLETNKKREFGNTLGVRLEYFVMSEKQADRKHLLGGMGTNYCQTQAMSDNGGKPDVPVTYAKCTMYGTSVPEFQPYCKGCAWSMDYLEAQIWGPITIDDVESFYIHEDAPLG